MNDETLTSPGDYSFLTVIGKTAFTLFVIIIVILACAWLFQRVRDRGPLQQRLLKVVASAAVGNRERVVVVEISDTWLVLGVSAGSVTRLHEMPAEESRPSSPPSPGGPSVQSGSFAQRFSTALGQQLGTKRQRENKS